MINYSIVMRSVNANLLEINQAKSRINQAKKDGKEPDKKDTDLVKTEKQNAFATLFPYRLTIFCSLSLILSCSKAAIVSYLPCGFLWY